MFIILPVAASGGNDATVVSVNDNPVISDPGMVQDDDCIDEPATNVPSDANTGVSATSAVAEVNNNPVIADPSMVQTSSHEDDVISEMIIEVPSVAEDAMTTGDGNNDGANPTAAEENDYIGTMIVTTSVGGAENPNDNPTVDDPSKIVGDDYVGEMIVVVPSQSESPMMALDANVAAPDGINAREEVYQEDFIGEMVIIPGSTASAANGSSGETMQMPFSSNIFLPFVNQ